MAYPLYKQPLVHFLVLGALIFALYAWRKEPAEQSVATAELSSLIVVDRAALLAYMQYQAGAFDPDVFAARYDAMDMTERQVLASDFVREEALYREALKLGMDHGDYIIRQRLVQKIEFLLENLAISSVNPDTSALEAFYASRIAEYVVAPTYTFTHIFFDNQQGGPDRARGRAEATLAGSATISFDQAGEHGDRYPFLQDYVQRSQDFVVNNFSADFVAELDQLALGEENWHGPIASRYGMHLVMLRARTEAFTPSLAEISERVLADYRYEAMLRGREEAEVRVVADYTVALELE
jgi:hypothetical protein